MNSLAYMRPDPAAEWDPTRNVKKLPGDFRERLGVVAVPNVPTRLASTH